MIQDLSGSWCIKGTDESMTRVDSSVPLMHRDPSDLGSLILIQINPKEFQTGMQTGMDHWTDT